MRLLLFCLLFSSVSFAQPLKPVSFYLGHSKVSKEAKTFYKKLPLYRKNSSLYYNDPRTEQLTSSVMDSVLTSNNVTRPFYLYLMNRNADLADGSLMLTLLLYQYKILQTHPAYFFRYMLDNPAEKKKYFTKWAEGMASFGEQYCGSILNRGMDTCLPRWRRDVTNLLAKENTTVVKLANDFFELMHIPMYVKPILTYGAADNGKTINLATGSPFEVRLRECRGCASVWTIADIDRDNIRFLYEDNSNPSCTNCTGGNQDHSFYFKVQGKSKSVLSFTYFEETYTLHIVAE